MSRHRLKNAALLRDRKQREASKERNEISTEKENEEQEGKAKNTSMEIHLPVRESKKTDNEKRYSLRSFDTEVDSQGEFIYDGGSESSLRAQVIEDSENEGARNTTDTKNRSNSNENIENVRETDRKISVTDSDMSVDSLECLDLSSKEIQEKKKKKKRKIRKRVEEKISSKEDVTSSPSSVSQMPQLALLEDFQDSSVENSDNCTTKELDNTFKSNSTLSTRILSDLAQQIVSDIVRSALKKCGKPTPIEFKNLDNDLNEGQKTTGASVQSESSINDDAIEGTPTLEHAEIKLEFIEDNSEVDESKAGKLLTSDNENIGGQKCGDGSYVKDGKESIVLNDDKVEDKRLNDKENSVLTVEQKQQEFKPDDQDNAKDASGPDGQDNANDASGPSAEVKQGEVPQDSSLVQNSSGLIKASNEASNVRDNKSSLEVKETLDPEKRCSTEMLITDDAKSDESRTKNPTLESETAKSNGNCHSSSVSKSMETSAQKDSENDELILLPEVETTEQQDNNNRAVCNPPIRLYDTHVNITNRIINSVSQVLHIQTHYTTPTQSSYLSFHPDIPYYTTPERGFEGLLYRELTSNNQHVLEASQSESTKEKGVKKEKSRRYLEDQKSDETFQRFVQGQRFCSPDEHGSATSRVSGFPDTTDSSTTGVNTSYINTSRGTNPHQGYCYFVVDSDSTSDAPQKFEQDLNHPRVSTDEEKEDLDTAPVLEPRGRRHGERPKSSVYRRSISDQNERKRWITAIQEPDLLRTVHQRSSSADTRTRASRNNKCMSCPVLSEVSRQYYQAFSRPTHTSIFHATM